MNNQIEVLKKQITRVKAIGGTRAKRLAVLLALDHQLPVSEQVARKYRGIGVKSMSVLCRAGVVVNTYPKLSARAANCLSRAGVVTKVDARHAILMGDLTAGGTRNCGVQTYREICRWCGA